MPSNMTNYNAGYEAFMDDEEFDPSQDSDWQDGYLDAQAVGA